MGEFLPDGTIQGYSTICNKCGDTYNCNMQGQGYHDCKGDKIEKIIATSNILSVLTSNLQLELVLPLGNRLNIVSMSNELGINYHIPIGKRQLMGLAKALFDIAALMNAPAIVLDEVHYERMYDFLSSDARVARAGGDCICPVCNLTYDRHPNLRGKFQWITELCDGSLVKL